MLYIGGKVLEWYHLTSSGTLRVPSLTKKWPVSSCPSAVNGRFEDSTWTHMLHTVMHTQDHFKVVIYQTRKVATGMQAGLASSMSMSKPSATPCHMYVQIAIHVQIPTANCACLRTESFVVTARLTCTMSRWLGCTVITNIYDEFAN